MYLEYWQFNRKPFTQLHDDHLIWFRDSMASAFHTITLAVQLPPAIVWITGPEGSGKSALLYMTRQNFEDECSIITLKSGSISDSRSLLNSLAPDIHHRAHNLPGAEDQLKSVLVSIIERNNSKSLVICIDDIGEHTDAATMKELVAIENVCKKNDLPTTLLLVSENETSLPALSFFGNPQLTQLTPLSVSEAINIVDQRITASGGSKEIFDDNAKTLLAEYARGNIRQLLIFADLCLQVGVIKKATTIDKKFVEENLAPYLHKVSEIKAVKKEPKDKVSEESDITNTGRFIRLRNSILRAKQELHKYSSDTKTTAQTETGGEEEVKQSPVPPHRLISQIELETYKSTSDQEKNRSFVEKLQRKIADGQINLVEAIKQFDKSREENGNKTSKQTKRNSSVKSKPEKSSSTSSGSKTAPDESHLASLDAQLLYHRGIEVICKMLDSLRLKRFTDLTNVFSLATAINRSIRESSSLLKYTLTHHDDYDLQHHLINVGVLVSACAKEMGINEEDGEEFTTAGLLHDIGHLHTNEELIQSPQRFDRKDFRIIKRHPVVGRDMIIHLTNGPRKLAEIIAQEHERDDGLGYPNYLVGEQIHLSAKIIGVCDTFEALSHPRSYRKALSPEESLMQIGNTLSRRTDPKIVQALYTAVTTTLE